MAFVPDSCGHCDPQEGLGGQMLSDADACTGWGNPHPSLREAPPTSGPNSVMEWGASVEIPANSWDRPDLAFVRKIREELRLSAGTLRCYRCRAPCGERGPAVHLQFVDTGEHAVLCYQCKDTPQRT